MSDVVDRPVLYMPIAGYVTARDGKQNPILTIRKQTGWSNQVASRNSLTANSERLRVVVLNTLHDCQVEGVSVYPKHSYQSGQPVVTDANGVNQRQPSAVTALAGGTGYDWVDAPPANFAAVGAWATNRPAFSFYGTDIGLTVEMPAKKLRFQASVIMNIKAGSFCVLTDLTDSTKTAVTDEDFYDECNEQSYAPGLWAANSKVHTLGGVKVSVRMGPALYGYDLYAFVEAA